MSQNPYHKAEFLISAPELSILPTDLLREVAFAGRSNAGKSSALNTITEQKSLARTSKTPGRTQAINVFALGDGLALVDLPGYGYAKVPDRIRKHWNQALPAYLEKRQSLVGLVVIMDVRHPLTELDQQMLHWSGAAKLPTHCLLTKADKLKRGPAMNTLQKVQNQLKNEFPHATAQLFSSQTRAGVEEARAVLNHWFELG